MASDEERREVALSLRAAKYGRHSWERALYDAIGADLETAGNDMLDRLADLIEPEPERTSRNVYHNDSWFQCSECGAFTRSNAVTDTTDYLQIRYCPNCGAKVVRDGS